jgi:hypothetical protein
MLVIPCGGTPSIPRKQLPSELLAIGVFVGEAIPEESAVFRQHHRRKIPRVRRPPCACAQNHHCYPRGNIGELKLKKGDTVFGVVKATEVMRQKD